MADAHEGGAPQRPALVRRAARGAFDGTRGVALGARAILRGVGRLVRTPWLWPYGVAPVLVALVVFGGTLAWTLEVAVPAARDAAAERLGDVGGVAAWIVTFLLVLAAFAFAFYAAFPSIVRVVAAPFLALLSDRAYREIAGHPAPQPPGARFVRWVLRPIGEALVLLAIRLVVTALALPLLCIPVAGPILFFLVLLPLEGMDLLDLAQSARAVPLGRRLAFVRGHLGASAGLGLGAAGVLFVPGLNVLFLPALVVGAVLLDAEMCDDFAALPEHAGETTP